MGSCLSAPDGEYEPMPLADGVRVATVAVGADSHRLGGSNPASVYVTLTVIFAAGVDVLERVGGSRCAGDRDSGAVPRVRLGRRGARTTGRDVEGVTRACAVPVIFGAAAVMVPFATTAVAAEVLVQRVGSRTANR